MTTTNWKRQGQWLMVLLVLTGALMAVTAAAVGAHSDQAPPNNSLAGAWSVYVTQRNCTTNAPTGSFSSLVSFHRGGTLTESAGSLAFEPGQRSVGHGAWHHLRGRQYSQRVVALILFGSEPNLPNMPGFDPTRPVSPGFSAGYQTITHTVQLIDADNFESAGTSEFVDSLGQSYRSGCSTAVGRRFE
jgi:hypothetical protein